MSKEQVTTPQIDANGVVIPDYQPAIIKPKTSYVGHVSDPGDHIYQNVEYYIEDGIPKFKEGNKVDWFGYIQASKSTCDLSQIVARYLSGDSAVVNVNNPIYGDIASMPKNVNELNDLAQRTKQGYDNLSAEIKSIFGNSFEQFYNAVLNNQVNEKLAAYAKAKQEALEKEAATATGGNE